MRPKAIVVIASSTGGPQILRKIATGLPVLNAAVLIVQHMQARACSHFALNLAKVTEMDVKVAEQGESFKRGTMYVAPAGVHLLVNGSVLSLVQGQKVNFVCPSADVTMKSLTRGSAGRSIGIVLSGLGEDGARGIEHMKQVGATTIVQAPGTCVVSCMPDAALETGCVDYVLRPEQIQKAIIRLCGHAVHV